jgi:hypothetical protein
MFAFVIKLIFVIYYNYNIYATTIDNEITAPTEQPPAYNNSLLINELQQIDNQLPNYNDITNQPPSYYEAMQHIFLNTEQTPSNMHNNHLFTEPSTFRRPYLKPIIVCTTVVSFIVLFIPLVIYSVNK